MGNVASCEAEKIRADTDIAGPGVLTSFLLTAWLTIAAALIPQLFTLRRSLHKTQPTWYKRFKLLLPTEHVAAVSEGTLDKLCDVQILTGSAVAISGLATLPTSTFYHQAIIASLWWLTLNSIWMSRVRLDFVPDSPITMLHQKARINSELLEDPSDPRSSPGTVNESDVLSGSSATTSHASAAMHMETHPDVSSTQPDQEAEIAEEIASTTTLGAKGDRHEMYENCSQPAVTRRLLILTTTVLGGVYQAVVFKRQLDGWDIGSGDTCYIYHDPSPDGLTVFWLIGLLFFVLLFSLTIHPKATFILAGYFKLLDNSQKYLDGLPDKALNLNFNLLPSLLRKLLCSLLFGGSVGLKWFFWLFRQVLALWTLGEAWPPIQFAAYIGFATWATYDLLDVKFSNQDIVDHSENSWGFGQVLPLILLFSIALQFIDAVSDEKLHKK